MISQELLFFYERESYVHTTWKISPLIHSWLNLIIIGSHIFPFPKDFWQFFVTPWPLPLQAPLSMWFPRQEYQSGEPFPVSGDLPHPGMEPGLLHGRQILYWLYILLINIYLKIESESVSHVPLFATLWPIDHQAPLSIGFSRQEYWSG